MIKVDLCQSPDGRNYCLGSVRMLCADTIHRIFPKTKGAMEIRVRLSPTEKRGYRRVDRMIHKFLLCFMIDQRWHPAHPAAKQWLRTHSTLGAASHFWIRCERIT